jgi:hypothetical protein
MITSPRAAVVVPLLSLSLSLSLSLKYVFLFLSPASQNFICKYVKNFPGGGLKTREITRESLRTNARIINHFL